MNSYKTNYPTHCEYNYQLLYIFQSENIQYVQLSQKWLGQIQHESNFNNSFLFFHSVTAVLTVLKRKYWQTKRKPTEDLCWPQKQPQEIFLW